MEETYQYKTLKTSYSHTKFNVVESQNEKRSYIMIKFNIRIDYIIITRVGAKFFSSHLSSLFYACFLVNRVHF